MQGPGQVAGSRKLLSKEALDKVKRELEALKEIYGMKKTSNSYDDLDT